MRKRRSGRENKHQPRGHLLPASGLTSVLLRKFPMASSVARMQRSVLFFSSWSIPSFRSCRGSATSWKNTSLSVRKCGHGKLVHLACFLQLLLFPPKNTSVWLLLARSFRNWNSYFEMSQRAPKHCSALLRSLPCFFIPFKTCGKKTRAT